MAELRMARQALHALASRIHTRQIDESDPDAPGYTSLIDILDDIGRSFTAPRPDALRDLLPAFAAGREALEQRYLPEDVFKSPWGVLTKEKDGAPYVAGALWAISAVVDGYLRELDFAVERGAGRSGRALCRDVALSLVDERGVIRPGDVLIEMQHRGVEVDRSTVSRAIADLLEAGDLEPTDPPEGAGSRSYRFYARAKLGERKS